MEIFSSAIISGIRAGISTIAYITVMMIAIMIPSVIAHIFGKDDD